MAGNDYTLSVTWTPSTTGTNIGAVTYNAATITVTCEVTRFDKPTDPAPITYYVNGDDKTVDLRNEWSQYPSCGYAYTETISWTNLESWMTADPSTGVLTISST